MISKSNTNPLKRMNLHPDVPSLHLEWRAHGLTSPPHVDRISKLCLAGIDQPLRFERLPLLGSRIFQLIVSPALQR
jgi:hypothetical protein